MHVNAAFNLRVTCTSSVYMNNVRVHLYAHHSTYVCKRKNKIFNVIILGFHGTSKELRRKKNRKQVSLRFETCWKKKKKSNIGHIKVDSSSSENCTREKSTTRTIIFFPFALARSAVVQFVFKVDEHNQFLRANAIRSWYILAIKL